MACWLSFTLLTFCQPLQPTSTFSIVAFDPKTGDLGVAVASKFLAVGSVVPYAKAGVGAIATQSFANTTFGPKGLELLRKGLTPSQVLKQLLASDKDREFRQVGIVDAKGRAAAFTGKKCLPWAGHIVGKGFAVQGNILAGEQVVKAMAKAFRETQGELAERLMAALEAGEQAGGGARENKVLPFWLSAKVQVMVALMTDTLICELTTTQSLSKNCVAS